MKYVEPVNSHAYPERNGSYVTANSIAGLRGSWVPGEALEHPMREIIHVIQMAGLEPSSADLTQLYQAIMLLYPELEGFLPLAGGTMEGSILANNDNTISLGSAVKRLKEIFSVRFRGIADSADKLQVSRNINGVPFNGTQNITVHDGTKLPLAGGTMEGSILVNNDNAISLGSAVKRLKEIFSVRFRGIADSADRLQTPRAINGVYFDGTSNIVIYDATKAAIPKSSAGVGQWIDAHVNGCTLPAGGTWAYFIFRYTPAYEEHITSISGIAAGGTMVANWHISTVHGFAWRIG